MDMTLRVAETNRSLIANAEKVILDWTGVNITQWVPDLASYIDEFSENWKSEMENLLYEQIAQLMIQPDEQMDLFWYFIGYLLGSTPESDTQEQSGQPPSNENQNTEYATEREIRIIEQCLARRIQMRTDCNLNRVISIVCGGHRKLRNPIIVYGRSFMTE